MYVPSLSPEQALDSTGRPKLKVRESTNVHALVHLCAAGHSSPLYIPLAVAHTRLYIPASTQGTPDVCDVCTHHVHMHLHMCKHTYTCIYTCTWRHNNTPICTVQMSTV